MLSGANATPNPEAVRFFMSPPLADTAVALRCCAPARCVVPPCLVLPASGRRLHCQPLSPSGRSLGASCAAPGVIPAKAGTSFPLKRCASHISSGRRHRAFCSAPLLGRPPAVTCRSAKAHRVFSPPTACHLCPRPNLVPGLQRFAAQGSTAPAAPSFLSPRTPVGGVGLPGATGRTSPW